MTILTLNSLNPKDHRLKEKMLEAVGQGKERMTDTVFRHMIGEHEAWLANNDVKGTTKEKKSTKSITCWCCGDRGHFRDRGPKREKAFCKKCKNKGHYEKACIDRSATLTSRDYAHTKRTRSTTKDKGSRTRSKSRSSSRGKGERRKNRERSQAPSATYSARARAVTTTRYSDSDIDKRRSRTSSRSPDRCSKRSRHSALTKKVSCQQGKGLKEWGGLRQ